jgi:hypothetical protein
MQANDSSPLKRDVSALDARIQAGKADPISAAQRAAAARIRIVYDKKRGHKTENWIKKLAKSA